MTGLPVSNLVQVNVSLSPTAAAARSFGILLVMGDSNVINGLDRVRTYTSITQVANDFGTSAPEYLAAALYFSQISQPQTVMIGRWLRTATSGINLGGLLTAAEQVITNWTSITTGSFTVHVDGTSHNVTGLNFSAALNMNGIASVINTAISSYATCTWNGSQFVITSLTTGTSSAVTALTAEGTGVDVSAQLLMTASTLEELVPGYAAEAPLAAVEALDSLSTSWYGLTFACATFPVTSDYLAIAGYIEADNVTRMFGITVQDTNALVPTATSDLGYQLEQLGYLQTWTQYSSQSAYASASLFGRLFSVDFAAQNSTITAMYKQEPGVTGEILNQTQANSLQAKRYNVFIEYQNNTQIVQFGTMVGPAYIDDIHNIDWFQNAVQTAVYNLLYTSTTKVPQTDSGMNQFVNVIGGICQEAVNNGMLAPGTWTAAGFGNLATGDFLKFGYYIYAPPMSSQSQSDRENRIAPTIQVAVKLAGAIQQLVINVSVNR